MRKRKFSKNREIIDKKDLKTSFFSGKNVPLFVVSGILLIMILSIFAVGFGGDSVSETNKLEYKGYNFVNREGIWTININSVKHNFEYSPNDVETVSSINFKNINFPVKTYLIFNPDEFSENSLELARIRQFLFYKGISTSLACIKEQNCGDLPIVDCNTYENVIYFKNGETTQIYLNNKCIVLESVPGNEVKIINRFMYDLLGIIS